MGFDAHISLMLKSTSVMMLMGWQLCDAEMLKAEVAGKVGCVSIDQSYSGGLIHGRAYEFPR